MSRAEEQYGTIEEDGERAIVRLERELQATPAEVWQLLTDPEELALWLGAAEVEPRVGGTIVLRFDNNELLVRGHFLQFTPPTTLEYTWHESSQAASRVRFDLRPIEGARGTHLLITHTQLASEEGRNFAAGWHHHLELLAARLAGRAADWDWQRFNDLLEGYGGAGEEQSGKRGV